MIELGSVLELFKLQMIFETIKLPWDNTRKCMVDPRPDSATKYKGFIYYRTLEEANSILSEVREIVANSKS